MTMRRGADARFKIDGVLYAVQRYRRGGRTPGINVSNTEGVQGNADSPQPDELGFTNKLPDLFDGQFELGSATFDDAANPYARPVPIVEGTYHAILHYPAGLSGPVGDFGNCLCVSNDHSGQIPGPQPINFVFETDGAYNHPGEET